MAHPKPGRTGAALLMSAAVLAGAAGFATMTGAHTGATGVVKERMEQMKDAGKATKALADMMRGETAYDAAEVRALAERIAGHGGAALTKNFPEGSLEAPTEARPEIWEDWPRFQDLADQMKDYAGALAAAADNPRAGGGQAGGGMMSQGGGMMSQGGGMMSQGGGMMSQGGGMMSQGGGPTPEHLAEAPPEMAFRHLAQTCSACHKSFRVDK